MMQTTLDRTKTNMYVHWDNLVMTTHTDIPFYVDFISASWLSYKMRELSGSSYVSAMACGSVRMYHLIFLYMWNRII